jgi:hypothetical protein
MEHNQVIAEEEFLGAFTQLRKAAISFVLSVCPHVYLRQRMGQLDSH